MELEKEVRYKVSNETFERALKFNTNQNPPVQVLDITCGAYGKESLQKTGMIFRVRQKGNKYSLEIKKRTEDNNWIEESISLPNAENGLNFLNLAGIKPYLYINRMRTSFTHGNLKIDMDDVELLGKFIEIEYQDSKDVENELESFKTACGILGNPAPLYGNIIFEKQETDEKFDKIYTQKLNEIINRENPNEK